jgi:hypothetical protein
MDIMMSLEEDALDAVKQDFRRIQEEKGEGVDLNQFVRSMLEHLPRPTSSESHANLMHQLCDLFDQIDVNGDGTLDWEEFTSFCVEAGMVQTRNIRLPLKYKYVERTDFVDRASHGTYVHRMRYIPKLQRLMVFDAEGTTVKVYNEECKLIGEIRPAQIFVPSQTNGKGTFIEDTEHAGVVLDIAYIDARNQLAICCSDSYISFWEPDPKHPDVWIHSILDSGDPKIPSGAYKLFTVVPQSMVVWSATTSSIFTCGSDSKGVISSWSLEHSSAGIPSLEEKPALKAHSDVVMDLLVIEEHDVLASASLDHKIILWDLSSGRFRGELLGHKKGVRQIAYSVEHDLLLSVGFVRKSRFWTLKPVMMTHMNYP